MADEKNTNALVHTSETLTAVVSAAGLDYATTVVDSTLGAVALSLADGVMGQRKRVVLSVDGGNLVVTPATFLNGTTITMDTAGDAADLEWVGTVGWCLIGSNGAPVVA